MIQEREDARRRRRGSLAGSFVLPLLPLSRLGLPIGIPRELIDRDAGETCTNYATYGPNPRKEKP